VLQASTSRRLFSSRDRHWFTVVGKFGWARGPWRAHSLLEACTLKLLLLAGALLDSPKLS
jgi:hypothetical protein